MKYLILLAFVFISSLGFSQDTGMIIGKILDKELNNEPLMFANISLKNSKLTSTSNETGTFLLDNLADGKHIVICSYPGYERREVEVEIVSGQPTEVKITLAAKRLTLATASTSATAKDQ